jgi:hypothetical protein
MNMKGKEKEKEKEKEKKIANKSKWNVKDKVIGEK